MSGTAKNIISLLPNLTPNELIKIQYLIELQLQNQLLDIWEQKDGFFPPDAQAELSRRIAAYEKGEVQAIPYKDALASIREKLRK